MRTRWILGILVGLGAGGCAHTRDISSTSQYKPWIGKTVQLRDWPQDYNIFARHSYFISTAASLSDRGDPAARLSVVIEASADRWH